MIVEISFHRLHLFSSKYRLCGHLCHYRFNLHTFFVQLKTIFNNFHLLLLYALTFFLLHSPFFTHPFLFDCHVLCQPMSLTSKLSSLLLRRKMVTLILDSYNSIYRKTNSMSFPISPEHIYIKQSCVKSRVFAMVILRLVLSLSIPYLLGVCNCMKIFPLKKCLPLVHSLISPFDSIDCSHSKLIKRFIYLL